MRPKGFSGSAPWRGLVFRASPCQPLDSRSSLQGRRYRAHRAAAAFGRQAGRGAVNLDAGAFSRDLCQDIALLFDDRAEFTATAKASAAELQADELVALAKAISVRALPNAA